MEEFESFMQPSSLSTEEQTAIATRLPEEIARVLSLDVRDPSDWITLYTNNENPRVRIPGSAEILEHCLVTCRMEVKNTITYKVMVALPIQRPTKSFRDHVPVDVAFMLHTQPENTVTNPQKQQAAILVISLAAAGVILKVLHDVDTPISEAIREIWQSIQMMIQ